jgi:hypothetical protein
MVNPKDLYQVNFQINYILFILYSVIGLVGLYSYEDKLNDLVLFNLSMDNIIFNIAVLMFCVQLAGTYYL